jgi:hypothetical protein
MAYRILLALLLAAAVLSAEEVKDAYHHAKRLRGDAKTEYAAQKAAEYDGKVRGSDLMYLGFLWQYAGQLEKADDALRGFIESGEGAKNRPLVMVSRARLLIEMGAYSKVAPVADLFLQQYGGHRYVAQMRFEYGRALRMTGKTEDALKQFETCAKSGYVHAPTEVVDCLLQLGRYDAAVAEAKNKPDDSYFAAVIAAADSFGKPLPNASFEFWTLKDLAAAELKDKPTVFAFWSMKARRANELLHKATNGYVARFKGNINAVGPTVYEQFDPSTMRTVDSMSKTDEQGFVESWANQYGVKYPLVVMGDDKLHKFCGYDLEHPVLPFFAVTDKKGMLRYVRVGPEDWAFEGVAAMLERLIKE